MTTENDIRSRYPDEITPQEPGSSVTGIILEYQTVKLGHGVCDVVIIRFR